MASSDSFLTNGWYSSSKGDYVYLEFAWSVSATSIANNTKTIYWELRGKRSASGFVNAGGFKVVIDGDTVYNKSTDYRIELRNGTVVASGSKTLTHNPDGTRSFSVSIRGAIYTYAVNCTGEETFDLDTIPRQATLTAAPNFTDLDNPTITYSNPAGNAVTDLKACISFTGAKDDIAYRAVTKTGSSYTFSLTNAERDVLRNNTPGTSRSVTFYVRTKIGGTFYYSSLKKQFSIAASAATKPTASMTLSPVSSLSEPFNSLYIQGKSKVKASLTGSAKYGATIVATGIRVEGVDYGNESSVLKQSGTQSILGAVKDSRGFCGQTYQDIEVIPYSKPEVSSADCYRSDGNGKKVGSSTSLRIKAKRSYSTVNGKNTCGLQWRWKLASESWNNAAHPWSWLLGGQDTTTDWYDALVPGEFAPTKAYTVQVQAIDDIGESHTRTFDIPTEDVSLHLGKGGKNVSIGSYCDYSQEHTFHSAWDATFDKGINGLYIRTVTVNGGTDIRLQTEFPNWDASGTSRQSFFVFGSANGAAVQGVCIVHNRGGIYANSITNCSASCEEVSGIVKLTLHVISWDQITILSARPFTIL